VFLAQYLVSSLPDHLDQQLVPHRPHGGAVQLVDMGPLVQLASQQSNQEHLLELESQAASHLETSRLQQLNLHSLPKAEYPALALWELQKRMLELTFEQGSSETARRSGLAD
jgi:hypothetical protein